MATKIAPDAERLLADAMAPRPFRVLSIRDETVDTFTLELESPDGKFPFEPGQFNMLYVFGTGEAAISISGDPAHPETLVHTVRGVGAVTKALRRVTRGSVLGVRGPFGNAWPLASAAGGDVVLVAGGIGLAPIRSAVYHVLNHRDDYGRVVVLYGTRTPADLLFTDEVSEWRGRFDMDVLVTVDNADAEWKGSVGVVTKLIGRAPFDPEAARVMVCGPEIMMRFTARALEQRGVDPERIFLSMERNMKCAVGFCGHCQFGPHFVCGDGPVFSQAALGDLLEIREI